MLLGLFFSSSSSSFFFLFLSLAFFFPISFSKFFFSLFSPFFPFSSLFSHEGGCWAWVFFLRREAAGLDFFFCSCSLYVFMEGGCYMLLGSFLVSEPDPSKGLVPRLRMSLVMAGRLLYEGSFFVVKKMAS